MNKKVIFIIIIVLLILGGGGFYMMKRGGEKPTPTPTPEAPAPQEEPTATPEQAPDISKFKVKVLNGTPVAGLAGKMKTSLEKVGFTVSGTGNADTKDYQQAEIQAKSSVPASVVSKLKDEISKTYTVGSDKTLADSSDSDIVIILGAKALPTATPGAKPSTTPAPTKSATVTPTVTPTSAPTPTTT